MLEISGDLFACAYHSGFWPRNGMRFSERESYGDHSTAKQKIQRRRRDAGGTKGLLLFEDERRALNFLGFEGDCNLDVVGDFDEGDAAVHAVVFAIENHFAVDALEAGGVGGKRHGEFFGI